MLSIATAEAKEQFTELVNRVTHGRERIILTRRGKDIAALVPYEDILSLLELQRKNDLDEALDALKQAREEGAVSLESFKDALG